MPVETAMAPGLSASLEDYLEAIWQLGRERPAARASDIAKRLGVKRSSVTGALRALAEKGLIHYSPYDFITLTPAGEQAAQDVAGRHEVLRDFFVRVLSVSDREAEEAACRMEHALSPALRRRLTAFARFMEHCPLGGPAWSETAGYRCDRRTRCPSRPAKRRTRPKAH